MFFLHISCFTLPIDTKWRIRDDVVKGIALEFIRIQGVAELHVFRIATTDQHVRFGDTKSKRVDFLAITDDFSLFVKGVNTLFHTGKHLTGAHRHIVYSLGRGILAGKIRIHGKQVTHQINNVTAGEVRTCFFIITLRKTLNKVFEDIAHINCGNFLRIHICIVSSKVADNLIQNSRIRHTLDLRKEAHIRQNVNNIIGEAVDVRLEIGLNILWVSFQSLEGVLAGIVKTIARCSTQKTIFDG